MHDVTPDGNAGSFLSFLMMLGVFATFGYYLVTLVKLIRRLYGQARLADQAADSAVLAEGAGVVVGTVEFEENAEYAVIVEIRQQGTQHRAGRRGGKKGSNYHRWKEVERRCFAQPFWIRHESGERVRVEPGDEVALVDRLDITVHDTPRERYRIAELSPGEAVVAEGTLTRGAPKKAQGYREAGPREWVLVQGDAERLHLSAERLGDRHRREMRTYLLRLTFGWLPCALVACLIYAPHVMRMTVGTPSVVTVTSVSPHHSGTDFTIGYDVRGIEYHEAITLDEGAVIQEGDSVAFIDVQPYPSAGQLGSYSTSSYVGWFVAMLFAMCAYLVFLPPRDEWHRTKKFDQRRNGKLPDPKPSSRKILSRL